MFHIPMCIWPVVLKGQTNEPINQQKNKHIQINTCLFMHLLLISVSTSVASTSETAELVI